MRKLKLLFAALALMMGVGAVNAETDYTSLMSGGWTGSGGDFQTGREKYNGDQNNFLAGKILYQSFTAPVTGIYEIKFYSVTSCTASRYKDKTPYYGSNIAQAFITAGSNKSTVAMEVINQTGCTLIQDANIRTLSIEANEGETIEYGVENIAEGGNWYTIKALSAKMKTVAEIFQDQYGEAYAIWQYSTENVEGAKATFKSYVDALNTAMSGTLAEAQAASDNLAAQLVIYEGKSYPIKGNGVKYDFTSKMNMAINAWTCAQGNGPAQYGFTGATETYGVNAAGEVMYQTISGLANGEYEIHFYAVGNAANGGGTAGEKLATIYAGDQTLDIDIIAQNACTPSDYERTFTVMVTDGTLTYGIRNKAVAGNWYICKNVALYMTGAPDLSDYYDAIAAKLLTANGLKSSPMKSTMLTDLQNAIDATEGYESVAVIGTLETLSDGLTTAINNANTSIGYYTEAKAILDAANSLDAAGKASYASDENIIALQTVYDNRTLEAATNEQKNSCTVALRAAAKAQTTEGADMTLAIVNPNIDGNAEGWTIEKTVNGNGPMYGTTAFEYWSYTAGEGGFDYYQTITGLPNGKYTVSAEMYNDQVQKEGDVFAAAAGVYGTSTQGTEYGLVTTQGTTLTRYTTAEVFVTDGTLRLGIKNQTTTMPARWFVADNFQLTFVRAATAADFKEILNVVLSNAQSIISIGANVGSGAFQIPESALSTLSDAKTTAQDVYDNGSATANEVQTAIDNLNSAVETYNGTNLNAPAADQLFNIILTYGGYEHNNKAVTYLAGDRADMGGYNIKYQAAANTNLAQAFTFTNVSGNNYKLSQIDADGNVRYVSTGTPYEGNANQIRTTTNEGDAAVFTVIATATDGVYNLKNVEADNYLGSQDEGVFTVNSHINFNIVETKKASVEINTTAAGYGTTMLPFAVAEFPVGVKAYTCAAVDGNLLTLAEVTALEANKPYIIEGSWEDVLTGNALGVNTSYTEGLLTGTYEDMDAPNESYILQNQSGKVGFYQVDTEAAKPKVRANRAYMTIPSAGARAYFFTEGEETAVKALNALMSGKAEVFNLKGVCTGKLQKGMNIIMTEGKIQKVMVK